MGSDSLTPQFLENTPNIGYQKCNAAEEDMNY